MTHEEVGIGRGHTGAHGRTFDVEGISGVEGEVVVDKDTSCELAEELTGWLGVGRR